MGLPLRATAPATPDAMMALLQGPDSMATRWPIAGMDAIFSLGSALQRGKQAAKTDPVLAAELEVKRAALAEIAEDGLRATLARAIDADDGFRERLVAFWADHFTVVASAEDETATPYALIEEAIRPNVTQPFAKMLAAVTMHPAMLIYLDQGQSIGPNSRDGKKTGRGLNENLAREVLELHSLGVGGGYTQIDVHEMAKLLTGLTYDPRRGFAFDGRRAEPGAKTIFGKTYDGAGIDPIVAALGDIARRAETGRHLARKLAVHFLSDAPDERVIDAMAAVWDASGGDLAQVYTALLNDPAAWAPVGQKVRQPWEFVLAAIKALGVTGAEIVTWPSERLQSQWRAPLREMGQPWKSPRGPDGWPEAAEAWITPQGLAARITWAMTRPADLVRPLPVPADLARHALGAFASPAVILAAERAENLAEGVGIVLASPEFNRR
jgi:uncharacterized protein (DUF1800 family)